MPRTPASPMLMGYIQMLKELTYVNRLVGCAMPCVLDHSMLGHGDAELFDLMATSFILRGRSHWHCSELVDRLASLGMPTECREGLKNLCNQGWLTEISEDVFSLTAEGIKMAKAKIGPFTAGGL